MDLDSDEPENFSVQPISETNVKKKKLSTTLIIKLS